MGLRQRQKQERTQRILEVAAEMFKHKGFETTRVEDIVEAANLSPATFYNYFQNKGDILLATIVMEQTDVVVAGEKVLARHLDDVEEALHALITAYYDNSYIYATKEMWRQAMAITIQQSAAPFAKQFLDIDAQLQMQACRLLRDLQARGKIASHLDPDQVGEVVFSSINQAHIVYLRSDDISHDDMKIVNRRQSEALASMLKA